MTESQKTAIVSGQETVRSLALELAFTEAGKDSGLLPINSFILQLEESLLKDAPSLIAVAIKQARAKVDRLFDTTAKFDAETISWLGEWHGWMSTALERWGGEQPLPETPAGWGSEGSAAAAVPAPPPPASKPAAGAIVDSVSPLTRIANS